MNRHRIACQTYTWQMSGNYVGKLDHILGLLGQTGFCGVEPETQFLGRLADPGALSEALTKNGIELASLCLVEDWLAPEENAAERSRADECFELLAHFPGTLLNLCQMPTTRPADPAELRDRQDNLLSCVHAVAERAAANGIECGYHPNSPGASIFRTADDYKVLLSALDDRLGWVPDCGHIAAVGMDPLALIKEHRELVRLVHYKDMDADGTWAEMGQGVIDYEAITRFLVETGYTGWFVVEDESDRAIPEPDQVTLDDWSWIEQHLIPIVS
ncbi:MAG: inosose dehydratase [Rhodothermales bacterium]|jgi:inosose dehydratase